jgi:hypothetical protein
MYRFYKIKEGVDEQTVDLQKVFAITWRGDQWASESTVGIKLIGGGEFEYTMDRMDYEDILIHWRNT